MTRAKMAITPEDLTPEAFARFGNVIDVPSAKENKLINEGNTVRYHDLASLSLTQAAGTPLISIFRSTPLPLPITLKSMECHPLSSQAFYPLSQNPYLVVVAPAGEFQEAQIRVFMARSDQGVNYHPGTWHHYSLALNSVSDFLVIDRGGPGENCDEVDLHQPLVINLDQTAMSEKQP
ncbi:MAG: ureidoglycolate lyase [Proteobacteria bacterium]|nr:ureidoglycolate lyase [Pseudomonadota bacterium]